MRCHEFKGGTGTASRVLSEEEGGFTVGAIVQANHGTREEFRVAGIPFGKLIKGYDMDIKHLEPKPGDGSIIVVVATDSLASFENVPESISWNWEPWRWLPEWIRRYFPGVLHG